jgi:hypothetical protein
MPKGERSEEGATRVSPNMYHYTKQDGKWRLTHHLTAVAKLGRPLAEDERVHFVTGVKAADRCKLEVATDPDKIIVVKQGRASARRRLAIVETRIAELQAEADELRKQLGGHADPEKPLHAELRQSV